MTAEPELKWTADLARSFAFIESGISEQPMLFVAYLVFSVFAGLLPAMSAVVSLLSQIVLLVIACNVARKSWSDAVDENTRSELTPSHGGAPLLSLVFLQILFYMALTLLFFVLIVPALWWAISSSLAIIFVSVEDIGAVEALKASHKLVSGRFWQVCRYLVPIGLAVLVPMYLIWGLMDVGFNMVLEQVGTFPIVVGGQAVKSLLKGVSYFAAQLLIVACLARLYVTLKGAKTGSAEQSVL